MARTSKTVIGDSGASNDRMMRAASSGAEAVSQAHSQLLGQYRSGAEQATRDAAQAGQAVDQDLDRSQQQAQFKAQMEQRQSETALEGAKAGFEQGSEPPSDEQKAQAEGEARQEQGDPAIGPLDPESQGRLKEAVGQKLEMDGQGRWRPTQERKDEKQREMTRKDYAADTDRMRAISYKEQVATSAQKALRSGDKEAYNENAKTLANFPNDRQKQYDRLMKWDEKINENDWSDLAKSAAGSEEVEPTLMADIKAKNFTPRVAAFVRAQVGKEAMESIVGSMGDTSHLKIDWTNPVMHQFQQMVQAENEFMRANPAISSFAAIKDTESKMRFLNVMAAAKVYSGMGRAPNPSAGMMPATASEGAAPSAPAGPMGPEHSAPAPGHQAGVNAVQGARAGGATPQQALQAGQNANQTTGQVQRRPEGGQFPGGVGR